MKIIDIFIFIFLSITINIFALENNLDSDKDGYLDSDELKMGTNPFDDFSVIYQGFWPYNSSKDSIYNPGFGECPNANGCECENSSSCPENSKCTQLNMGKFCTPLEGSRLPRFTGVDQFGDIFDLYDLAHNGKPIIIEIGTSWPQACKDLSAWRSYVNEDAITKKWWKNKFLGIRELIDNQEVHWVHIIHLDSEKKPASFDTIDEWYWNYPHENIILLADPEAKMKKWIRPTGYPCLVLVDENMDLKVHALRGIEDAIDGAYKILGKDK